MAEIAFLSRLHFFSLLPQPLRDREKKKKKKRGREIEREGKGEEGRRRSNKIQTSGLSPMLCNW